MIMGEENRQPPKVKSDIQPGVLGSIVDISGPRFAANPVKRAFDITSQPVLEMDVTPEKPAV